MYFLIRYEKGIFTYLVSFLQKLDPQSSHEETSDKLKLRHILQMPNQDFSKVSFVKDRERLRNCHRWEEIKETRRLNVICYLDWTLEKKMDEICVKSAL